MSGGWWVVLVGVSVFAWSLYLDLRHDADDRLAGWWVARARRQGGWAGPLALLTSLAALAGFCLLGFVAVVAADVGGDPLWALVVLYPTLLAYGPFMFATAPTDPGLYRAWRDSLERAGADRAEQRAIAWWAGPPSLAGLVLAIVSLFAVFLD